MQRMTGIDPMFIYSDTRRRRWRSPTPASSTRRRLDGGYSFERVSCGARDADPDAAAVPAPAHARPARPGPPALGGRPRLRPGQPPAPGRAPGAGRRRRVPRHGGRGDGPPAPPGAAAVGDARHRGDGRRHGRADRQGPPLRHRRRGRRRDAGQAARPDARGQRRDRALPALGARAGLPSQHAADDRRAAELRPEPDAGDPCGAARSAAPRCGWPAAPSTTRLGPVSIPLGAPDTFESPVGARRAVSFAELDMDEGARAEGPLRVDDQRRRARRLLGRAALPPGRARPGRREPAGRRSCRCRCAASEDADGSGNHLSAMFVPLSNDRRRRSSACAR